MSTPISPEPSSLPSSPAARPQAMRLALARADGGGGSPFLKVVVATVLVVLAIGAYVYFGQKPPVVEGEVTHLTAYPIHSISNAIPEGSRAAKVEQTFDQTIVIAEVRLHNRSQGPLFLSDIWAVLSLPGEEHRSLAASADSFNRVFVAYPQLLSMKQQPLLRDTTIPAGQTVEGQLIFNYPVTKEQWDLRRALDITASFLHQNDLTMPVPQ